MSSPADQAHAARPVQVLHVITTLDIGGAELSLARLLAHMDPARFSQRVVSLLPPGPVRDTLDRAGIPVSSLHLRPGRISLGGLRQLRRLLHDTRPDLIVSWLYHADLLATLARLPRRSPPLIWNLRASHMDMRQYSWVSGLTRRACAWLSPHPAIIVANSSTGRAAHEALGYRPRAWQVIPNGIDTDRYQPDPEARAAVARELSLPDDPRTRLVGVMARLDAMKGHAPFLDAARQIARRLPHTHFLLAGTGVDAQAPLFARAAADEVLRGRLHLLGPRRDVPRLLAALDLYCSPSLGEGFPNAVAEAMACGVPCVASDAGDSRHIVSDTGLIVPVADANALAAGCISLLEHPLPMLRTLGHQARARIVHQFGLPRAVREYEQLFLRTLDDARGNGSDSEPGARS